MIRRTNADSSPEKWEAISLPPIEWMLLDETIQQWTDFGRVTVSEAGLRASSFAFAALACETFARETYTDALNEQNAYSPSPQEQQAALTAALAHLSDACRQWLDAASFFQAITALTDEEAAPRVHDLDAHLVAYEQRLFALFWRLLRQLQEQQDTPGTKPTEEVAS